MFKSSIQWKILTLFILLTVSVMVFVAIFSASGISRYYHEEFVTDMQEATFTESMTEQLKSASNVSLYELTSLLEKLSVRVGIDSYRDLYVLSGYDAEPLYSLSGKELSSGFEITENVLSALSGSVGNRANRYGDIMDYALPLKIGDEVKYIIYVTDTKVEMHEVMKSILKTMLLALLIGLVISAFLGFLLSSNLIAPLKRLRASAAQMAEGKFTGKIKITGTDEIGSLTRDFNYMSEAIETGLVQMAAEKNKVETVLLYMTDGVIAFNSDGNLIHINPAARKMLDIKEDEELKFDEFFKNLGTDFNLGQFLYLSPEPVEKTITFGDKHFMVYLAPLIKSGKSDGVVSVFHDYTRQQKLDDARREFVANVSHELRTPITVVKSYAETLLSLKEHDETEEHFLNVINEEADRMTRLVHDLLALSRLDNNKEMKKLPFNPSELANSVCDRMEIQARERSQVIIRKIKADNENILGDKDRIEQVLVNIVGNAIKYTKDGGRIKVSTEKDDSYFYIKVKDNGIGIPKEDTERIFERFYRVDKARSRSMGGTGLGLAIAKEIVEAHKGKITLVSQENKGTEVTVALPY